MGPRRVGRALRPLVVQAAEEALGRRVRQDGNTRAEVFNDFRGKRGALQFAPRARDGQDGDDAGPVAQVVAGNETDARAFGDEAQALPPLVAVRFTATLLRPRLR